LCANNDVTPSDQTWAVIGETGKPSSARVIAGSRISFNDNCIEENKQSYDKVFSQIVQISL
jgi:hypothetical protein